MSKKRELEKQELIECFHKIITKDISEIMKIDKNEYNLKESRYQEEENSQMMKYII